MQKSFFRLIILLNILISTLVSLLVSVATYGVPSFAGGVVANNLIPTITNISPNSAIVGGPAFTLTVNGTNFINGFVVNFNGQNRTTGYISPTEVRAFVPASAIAAIGTYSVKVLNPASGGGVSNAVPFYVSIVPKITNINPASVIANNPAFTLTVYGKNFLNDAIVFMYNLRLIKITLISPTEIRVQVPESLFTKGGIYPFALSVCNPPFEVEELLGEYCTFFAFEVVNPVPTITGISPTSAVAGSGRFTLTVNGTNFVGSPDGTSASIVEADGMPRTTTFVSSTQLTAQIDPVDIAFVGRNPIITVMNPAPGGGTSNAVNFTVNP